MACPLGSTVKHKSAFNCKKSIFQWIPNSLQYNTVIDISVPIHLHQFLDRLPHWETIFPPEA